jgi:hypothetical protein
VATALVVEAVARQFPSSAVHMLTEEVDDDDDSTHAHDNDVTQDGLQCVRQQPSAPHVPRHLDPHPDANPRDLHGPHVVRPR